MLSLKTRGFFGRVFQQDVSLLICDFGVEDRLYIDPPVGDGRVGGGELQIADAVGDAAQGQRLDHIPGSIVDKAGKPEAQKIIKSGLGRNLRQYLDRRDVVGVG